MDIEKRYSILIQLQNLLFRHSMEGPLSCLQLIKETHYFSDIRYLSGFIHAVNHAIKCNQFFDDAYIQLVDNLAQMFPSFAEQFLLICHPPFLHKISNFNWFDYSVIQKRFQLGDGIMGLIWLGPEIQKNLPELYDYLIARFSFVFENPQFKPFEERRFSDIITARETGYLRNELEYIIARDDADKLVHADLNQLITSSLYNSFQIFKDTPLLYVAAFYGAVDCFRYLFVKQSPTDMYNSDGMNRCLIDYACAGGSPEIIALLDRYNPNYRNSILSASIFHRNEIVHWLMQHKMDTATIPNRTPHIFNFNLELYQIFSSSQINNNRMLEIEHWINELFEIKQYELLEYIIDHTPEILKYQKITVEQIAMRLGEYKVRAMKGVDWNKANRFDETPLCYALKNKMYDIARVLISMDTVDVNLLMPNMKNCLHICIEEHNLEGIQILLDSGKAIITQTDIEFAKMSTDDEIIQLIVNYNK